MPDIQSSTLDRRTFVARALAIGAATGSTAAIPTTATAISGAAQPLSALLARRQAIQRHLNDSAVIEMLDKEHEQQLHAELTAIEERLEAAVPTTREDAVAQLRHLVDLEEEGWDFDERLSGMVRNVIAYLERMPAGGVV